MAGIFATTLVLFSVYQLTLVSLPYYLALEGYGEVGSGGLNATFMAGAVVGPLVAPRLLARPGLRATVAGTVVAQATFTLLLGVASTLWSLLALNAVRGVAFGIACAALPVALVAVTPAQRRATALGVWGIVCTLPAVVAPTLGVALSHQVTLADTTSVAGLAMLLGLGPFVRARSRRRWAGPRPRQLASAPLRGSRGGPYWAPALVFFAASLTYGGVASFMPLFLTGGRPEVATSVAFLLAMGCALPAGRLLGGAEGDGTRAVTMLPLGVALLCGSLALVLAAQPSGAVSALAGAVYGLGFGAVTTASQIALLRRAGRDRPDAGSAVFSAIFNAGIGLGGLGVGLLAGLVSLRAAFALCALTLLPALPLALAVARELRD